MGQQELFEDSAGKGQPDMSALKYFTGVYLSDNGSNLPPNWAGLFELSAKAFYAALHAQMSELPIKNEIARFVQKVCQAGNNISGEKFGSGKTAAGNFAADRIAAERAAFDRGDPDVFAVLKAAGRVQHEIHRITGLLRFSRGPDGTYTALCSPDFFILPALAGHFTLRFGESSWAIVDEKRGLCLCRKKNGRVTLAEIDSQSAEQPADAETGKETPGEKGKKDIWEDLWRLYHRSVNNEGKKNLRLQRQFMPERYHKYLPEMQ
jgi:hypothetical protein